MADPVCAECGKPILPTEDKTTIQDVPYHAACWTRRATRKASMPNQPKHPGDFAQRAKLFTAIETAGAGVNAAPRGAVERNT
jgi:hypothetical protein